LIKNKAIENIKLKIVIKGAGEVASAVANKLRFSGFQICLTEIPIPLSIHRGTSYSEAIWDKEKTVEGITARFISSPNEVYSVWDKDKIAVIIDPDTNIKDFINPDVFIDATMEKVKNFSTKITDAPLVIGLGPGFYAGRDVNLVVETNNSDKISKVIFEGEAEPYIPIPLEVRGLTYERVIRNSKEGIFHVTRDMGEIVKKGEKVAWIDDEELKSGIDGVIRAMMRDGIFVKINTKLAEIDPRPEPELCNIIRPRMRVIAGGVLEAVMYWYNRK
jgi:xanthine dehydrogenase accessory factor